MTQNNPLKRYVYVYKLPGSVYTSHKHVHAQDRAEALRKGDLLAGRGNRFVNLTEIPEMPPENFI